MSALLNGFRVGRNTVNEAMRREEDKRRYDQQFERQQSQDVLLNQIRQNQINQGVSQNALLNGQVADMPNRQKFINTQREQQTQVGANNVATSNNAVSNIDRDNEFTSQSQQYQLDAGRSQNAILNNTVNRLDKTNQMTDDMNAAQLSSVELQLSAQKKQFLQQDLQQVMATGDPELMGQFIEQNVGELQNTNMMPLSSIEGIQAGVALGDALDSGDLTAAAGAANAFFKPQLNKAVGQPGKDGLPISDIEIMGIKNEGEGFRIPVMVTTEGGNKYPSFISELRSSDPRDPEKNFSPDELVGTIKATHSVAKLLQGSSYYGRLMQNAQSARAAGQTQSKGNYKAVTGAMGNTTGYFDPNTQKFVPLPDGALGGTMATSVEEVQENQANIAQQQKSKLVSTYSNLVAQQFGQQGIDAKESQMIAEKLVDRIDAAKAAGQQLDLNAVAQEEVQNYMKTREQLKIDHAEQNKNVYKGVSAYDNNPYSNWK